MQFYSITDCGKKRENNEDFCIAKKVGDYTVLILADGMGGHNGGETASRKATETIFSFMEENLKEKLLPGQIMLLLSDALEKANSEIFNLSRENTLLSGMGTTAEVCIITKGKAYIAHIGDSRVYKISDKSAIKKLTKDHSLVEYMIENGTLTPEEASFHPQKNVITRALGISAEIDADIFFEKLGKNDSLILCSDGLSNMVGEDTILNVMSSSASAEEIAKALVRLANDAGGSDNITAIVLTPDSKEENI